MGTVHAHPAIARDDLRLTCVNDVKPAPVDWIWQNRIARGHVALVAGEPGVGKTQIKCDIASRISQGTPWPDVGHAPSGSVVMLSAEDPIKDVLRPRLEAAGADLRRIHVLEAVIEKGKERGFNLKNDLARLSRAVETIGDVALVTLDPITSYMGSDIDSHRTTDVRAVLEPLARFAEDMDVGVLCVSHPPKASQAKAINAVTGSLAFVAAARTVFVVTKEPETDRRLLLPVKNNLGAEAVGLGYRLGQMKVSAGIITSHVVWDSAPVTITADQAMQQSGSSAGGKTAEAKDFLREELANGPVPSKKLIELAEQLDISEKTLRRAKNELGLVNVKNGFDGGWSWKLPDKQ